MFSQAAAVQKRFPADGALLHSTAVVSDVENQVGLFRVTGTALGAGERPDLLHLMNRRSRVPVAEALLMAAQVSGECEVLAAELAAVLSL